MERREGFTVKKGKGNREPPSPATAREYGFYSLAYSGFFGIWRRPDRFMACVNAVREPPASGAPSGRPDAG